MRSKGRSWLLALLLFFVLAACVIFAMFATSRRMPAGVDSLKVSLVTAKKTWPVSPAWTKFLAYKEPKSLPYDHIYELEKRMHANKLEDKPRWISDLAKMKALLAKWAIVRGDILSLLSSKTCPPLPDDGLKKKKKEKPVSYFRMIKATRLLMLDVLVKAQGGDPDGAAKEIVGLLRGLMAQLQKCPNVLLSSMIQVAMLDIVYRYTRYVIVHPTLSLASKTALFKQLRQISSASFNPMPDALRAEAAFMLRALAAVDKGNFGEITGGVSDIPASRAWPWWDDKLTKKWLQLRMKAHIHRAMQPYGPGMWKRHPIDAFFAKQAAIPKWRLAFQYNAIGIILLNIASPPYGKFVGKWHQSRCKAALLQAGALQYWRKHQLPLPAEKSLLQIRNPLTSKPLVDPLGKELCAIVRPGTKKPLLRGLQLRFPAASGTAKATAPGPGAPKLRPAAPVPAANPTPPRR